jgi:hypothetical protein
MAGTIPVLAQRAASEGPRWTRAVGIIPAIPYKSDSSLRPCLGRGASLGEEAVLADSGWAGEVAAGVGRVRSPAFLSILRTALLLS